MKRKEKRWIPTPQWLDAVLVPALLGTSALFLCALGSYDLLMRLLLPGAAPLPTILLGIGTILAGYTGLGDLREALRQIRAVQETV
jgi:Na+/phosphate symporter